MSKQKKLNIIMFNMSSYTDWRAGIANRNRHVMETLAKDERIGKIVAVDFLPFGFGWKRKLKYFYLNLIKGVKACTADNKICLGSGETRFGDFTSRCYQITSKIYVFSSINKLDTVLSELAEVKKRLEMDNLIVWSYNPFIADLGKIKKILEADKVIFDAVDDWSKHSVYENKKSLLENNYRQIKQEANVVFTVSEELKDGLFVGTGHCPVRVWIPNGVDTTHFNQPTKTPKDLKNIKHPIIGYEGVIQDRLDIDLIKYLAQKNPDKSFIFVGWIWQSFAKVINQEFTNLENVYFLGRKMYDELPSYIQAFDAAIIPHKVNEFTKSMNPLKMYEYLACGKPVVSTQVAGVDEFGSLIKVAGSFEEFDERLNEVLAGDDERLRDMRVKAVREHSWEKRVEEMLENLV